MERFQRFANRADLREYREAIWPTWNMFVRERDGTEHSVNGLVDGIKW